MHLCPIGDHYESVDDIDRISLSADRRAILYVPLKLRKSNNFILCLFSETYI